MIKFENKENITIKLLSVKKKNFSKYDIIF